MSSSTKYTITNKLLANIKEITKVSCELNNKKFSHVTYSEILEKTKSLGPKLFSLNPEESKNYTKALEKFSKKNVAFDLNTILSIHSIALNDLASKNQVGKFRNAQAKKSVKTLVKFVNSSKNDLDTLILGGIFYKHFSLADPFVYGTERVSVLATRILLMDLGINVFNLFNFEKIGKVGMRDNTKWLEYFTDVVLQEMLRVKKELEKTLYRPEKELIKDQEKILKYLKKHEVITDSEYSKITERKKATRVLDFNKLIEKNLIERCGQGRQTYYILK
jgi:Fic family protein